MSARRAGINGVIRKTRDRPVTQIFAVHFLCAHKGCLKIHHRGAVNAGAATQWVAENFPEAETVLVTGCSAGSYGSVFWASKLGLISSDSRTRRFLSNFERIDSASAGSFFTLLSGVPLYSWSIVTL